MTRRTLLPALTLLVTLTSGASAQSPPPDGDWMTFRTAHFRVTYMPELEPLAREAGAVAERTWAVLARELTTPPGTIDLVVTDHTDWSNGFARPFPSRRILVFARPAFADGEFFPRDWMELVVAHEVVHAFHFDRSGAVGRAVRSVLGRVPFLWPVFPVVSSPAWSTEGLATHYESRLTGAGRVQSSIHDMIIRTAALEGGIPELDDLSAPNPVWPGGNRSYIYGARLMRYIADTYGPEAHRAIIDATAGSSWPTFLRFDQVADEAVGRPFDVLYDEWRAAARDTAEAVARRIRAEGETPTRPVAGRGPYALGPRVSPDGQRLAFAASDWRSDPSTRLVDLGSGGVRTLARRNAFGMVLSPPAWLPDGSGVVVSQLDLQGPYRAYSDLWRVGLDGRETRLTDSLRLAQPDVARDGRIAAVQSRRGGLRLVVYDPATTELRVLADAAPGEAFEGPRWSPDGRWLAVALHAHGRTDLVVLDPVTGATARVTDDTALDLAPAWSPDGRWLLWWSDRTGVPNIMAVATNDGRPAGAILRVTNVVTGAIEPEVSPDGETLYAAVYHDDGWAIESLPFDTTTWRPAPTSVDRYAAALLPPPAPMGLAGGPATAGQAAEAGVPAGSGAGDQEAGGEASSYSPLATLRPYHWLPRWQSLGSGSERLRFLGAAVEGWDVLERHLWALDAMVDIDTGRLQAGGFWVYRGLGNPTLFLSGSRDWTRAGHIPLPPDSTLEPALAVDDELAVGATFLHNRWRWASSLQLRAELERQAFQGRNLSRGELADRGIVLREPPTLAGLVVRPTFQNTRAHPFSISPEDGIRVSGGLGRWWETASGARGYDEATGRLAGYLAFPLWGFAHHVLALRGAGLVRTGARAPGRSIGGPALGDPLITGAGGSPYPVRGFEEGDRFGSRAWVAGAEWRFPLHLRGAPGQVLGLSLVSVSGALFVDAGNAWCTDADRARPRLESCADASVAPLVSTGAELSIGLGVFHNSPARLVMGLAQPLQGPGTRPVFYLGTAL